MNKFSIVGDLLAGIEQNLILSVSSGSSYFLDGTFLQLKCSRGLKLKVNSCLNISKNVFETNAIGFIIIIYFILLKKLYPYVAFIFNLI